MRPNKKLSQKSKGEKRFAFVVDGECEFWYVQMLKRNEQTINVTLEPKLPQKKTFSEQHSLVVQLSNNYDKVFWIVDFDVIIRETDQVKKGKKSVLQEFKEYHEKLIKNYCEKVTVIINNPCLEYWYLLHFVETSKPFATYEKLEKELKKHLANYSKSEKFHTKQNNDIYLQLKPFINTAIKNAKKLPVFDFSNPHSGMTQMQLFFETKEMTEIIKTH